MRSHDTPAERARRGGTLYRWLALCGLVAGMLPALPLAQTPLDPIVTILKSGSHTVFPGRILAVTVDEVGSVSSVSDVTIEIRDAADQRRGFISGELHHDQPVGALITLPANDGRQQLRAIVTIAPKINAAVSEPVVGMEVIDPISLRVETKPPCAVPSVVPSSGSGAEGNCDGWHVNFVAQRQTASIPY